MKRLEDILTRVDVLASSGDLAVEITGITLDSREVQAGYLFVAIAGHQVDGHDYLDQAIAKGAVALVTQKPFESGAVVVQVSDSAKALGQISSAFYDHPSSKLKLVGVTGTNGKTSITSMLYESFLFMGHSSGLLSTIRYSVNGEDHASTHTTPHAVRINELLDQMVQAGCEYAFMEVSSHALDQERVAGLQFAGAVFTNITHDHLDYHADFKEYLYTKKKLFDGLDASAFALINRDDKNGQVMTQNTRATRYTYSLRSVSDFKTKVIESDFGGTLLSISGDEVWVRLVGRFNAYNVLAVYATAFLLGKEHMEIITALSRLESVEGRFQHMEYAGVTAIVDYAHTPDALQNVLDTINAIRTKNEQLICVVGCGAGGDRDREKRPQMANIACTHADKVILTSDNPRSEEAEDIIAEMMTGVKAVDYKKVLKVTDQGRSHQNGHQPEPTRGCHPGCRKRP